METWQELLRNSITKPEELAQHFDVDICEARRVCKVYPMRINSYWLDQMKTPGDPFWAQAVPDPEELDLTEGFEDPLHEEQHSPVPGLTHRYPDRVLLLVSDMCSMYCRFCTRKRKVGQRRFATKDQVNAGIEYIRDHPEVRDVILSGGDSLMVSDDRLDRILSALRSIPHVEILRIGSRSLCTLPQRITPDLCRVLSQYHPLYLNTHFNHPDEITEESEAACARLADAGIPLGNQTVLLKGINDDPEVMRRLVHRLTAIRVRPYYLFQADLVRGTDHFRTPVRKGLEIIRSLQGFTSGLCIPAYVIDLPGGGGKVPLMPETVVETSPGTLVLRNYEGRLFSYPDVTDETDEVDEPELETAETMA